MILVDTSVWIDFFAGRENARTSLLARLIQESEDLCVCGIVMTETLQGIRSDREFGRVREILSGLIYLPCNQATFIQSAVIYRTLRKQGRTIRSPVDCLIAATCLEHEVGLLHHDGDFDVIAKHFSLKVVR